MSSGWLRKVRDKLRQHLLLQFVFDRLKPYGIHIMPYYLFLEGRCREGAADPAEPCGYEPCLLRPADMQALHHIDGRYESADELLRRLTDGHLCFGMKKDGKMAGFTWANLRKCAFEGDSFELSDHEAYLYDMHTVKAYRGQNAASCLRRGAYAALEAQGRYRFYSISERFNRSSIRFKEKLGARVIRSCLYVRLFDRLEFRWTMRGNRDKLALPPESCRHIKAQAVPPSGPEQISSRS